MKQSEMQVEFDSYIDALSKIAMKAGLPVRSEPLDLESLKSKEQIAFQKESSLRYIDLLESAEKEGEDVTNSKALTEFAIRKWNLSCSSIITNLISPYDVVEIYRFDNHQMFRTLNFLSYTTYSLQELTAFSWFELYKREMIYTGQIYTAAQKIIEGKSRLIEKFCQPHIVSENKVNGWKVHVDYNFIARTEDSEGNPGAIVCCRFDLLDN